MQITVVPTVTRPAAPSADDDTVTSTARVQVSLDLAGNAEHIEGTVRCGDRTAMPFSGWSELFAALVSVASGAGQDALHPGDRGTVTEQHQERWLWRPASVTSPLLSTDTDAPSAVHVALHRTGYPWKAANDPIDDVRHSRSRNQVQHHR